MKLLQNKNKDSIFVYFPGIDYPNQWTLDNPAVYHCVKESNSNSIVLPQFTFLSEAKYLLFKVDGEVKYSFFITYLNNNYYRSNLKAFFYDYLNYFKTDVEDSVNFMSEFIIPPIYQSMNTINTYDFYFKYPKYILMKIVPCDEDALSKNFVINSNTSFLQFDYSTHWNIDWVNRIDGASWQCNGKLNSSNSLLNLKSSLDNNWENEQ